MSPDTIIFGETAVTKKEENATKKEEKGDGSGCILLILAILFWFYWFGGCDTSPTTTKPTKQEPEKRTKQELEAIAADIATIARAERDREERRKIAEQEATTKAKREQEEKEERENRIEQWERAVQKKIVYKIVGIGDRYSGDYLRAREDELPSADRPTKEGEFIGWLEELDAEFPEFKNRRVHNARYYAVGLKQEYMNFYQFNYRKGSYCVIFANGRLYDRYGR